MIRTAPDNQGLFSETQPYGERPGERPEEDRESAPPGTREKLAMRGPVDDGKPARRRLKSLRAASGFRVEAETVARKLVKHVVREEAVPDVVSIRPMCTRSWWRLQDKPGADNPLFEFVREEREEPPEGSQWSDATSNQSNG